MVRGSAVHGPLPPYNGRVLTRAALSLGLAGTVWLAWLAGSRSEVLRSERSTPGAATAVRPAGAVRRRPAQRREWPSLYLVRGPRGDRVERAVYEEAPRDSLQALYRYVEQVEMARIAVLEKQIPCNWRELDRRRRRLSELRAR